MDPDSHTVANTDALEGRTNSRALDPAAVAKVSRRLAILDAAIRACCADPEGSNVVAVLDAARWARLDVDAALALKGHVADLRDEHWARLSFTIRANALSIFATFVTDPIERLDLVGMRNLRARLTGVIAVARGWNGG